MDEPSASTSTSTSSRKPAPSPLVFSNPESSSAPSTAAATPNPAAAAGAAAVSQSSNANQVSMPFIKRHVTRRLKLAKEECDKELAKVTDMITTFFEDRIRDAEPADVLTPAAPAAVRPGELRRAVRQLEAGDEHSDGESGDDADLDSNRLSTARSHPVLSRRSTSPEMAIPSVSSSPGALRRYPGSGARHHDQVSPRKASSSSSSSAAAMAAVTLPGLGQSVSLPAPGPTGSSTAAGRRLSRAIRVPVFPPSEASSRSTSRSRSPLPSARQENSPRNPNRRSSRIWLDEPLDPFMAALHGITAIATEIQDMSLPALTAEPGACNELVNRIQVIGKGWDEHPEWLGRGWYVQALLSVAKLARVVEWWQAEKQFWNFEEDDEESSEPLAFVLKPEPTGPPPEEESSRRRPSRPSMFGRRRDTHYKTAELPQHRQPVKDQETELSRVQQTEQLREKADEAQRLNIVVELSLDGDQLIWINHAWADVIGTDPEESTGTSVSSLLAPDDFHVFRDATDKLQEDDSHTIEIRFRMQVNVAEYNNGGPLLYREMEGKGMLMLDRGDGTPSHTMWVIKPIGPPVPAQTVVLEPGEIGDEPSASSSASYLAARSLAGAEPVTPFPFINRPISTTSILCRICECQVPEWFFEKHNETCNEVHKLEADIGECNDSIAELRAKIREIATVLENQPQTGTAPEYRGMTIYCGTPGTSSPLQLFRPALPRQFQKMNLRKAHQKVLEALDEILQVAMEVSVPALREDQAGEPIEKQRLLSPSSERKLTQLKAWPKPVTEDTALTRMILDVDLLIRTKLENVARMQNTIRYSEKVRQEWEDKVEQTLASLEEDGEDEDSTEEGHGDADTPEAGDGGYSSTTSEYDFNGQHPSSDPTPVQSGSPVPTGHRSTHSSGGVTPSVPIPQVPATFAGVGSRSSTPSSVSSPLARAVPIVASADLAAAATAVMTDPSPQPTTLHRQVSSVSNIDSTKVTLTPPLSPMLSPKEGAPLNRRHSTALHAVTSPPLGSAPGPLSPRIPSLAPSSRTTPSSIKDFEIIKPISKGAFGSVFLAKKKTTGDYFAIKVLKKADMIAKNQITNVKAERMILMRQAESPFVVKLFFTFQSKDNLYLVMEYLNGGDCAALIKSLGSLPEEWTKNYVAEVVLGLEYLHERGVVHRDLKPDNLLIDQYGHLKLTDFGLSRIGLLGRQTRETAIPSLIRGRGPSSRPPSIDSAYLSSPILFSDLNTPSTGYFAHRGHSTQRMQEDESSGSESLGGLRSRHASKPSESPLQSFAMDLSTELRSQSMSSGGTPPGEQKFVGTPDYLAPETILGYSGDDRTVDWWALGVITYEFLYGIPPFHAETPEKVFDNIISRRIEWHEDLIEYSPEARDFIEKLLVTDPAQRLGANSALEVKAHPWFSDIEWDKVMQSKAQFIPQITDPESTDYFDPRGASSLLFQDEEPVALHNRPPVESPGAEELLQSTTVPLPTLPASGPPSSNDDFGAFSFKNLPVLKHANDEVIRKLRSDNMQPLGSTLTEPVILHSRRKSLSQRIKKPSNLVTDTTRIGTNPPSPTTSTSSIASSPSRGSIPAPIPPGTSGSHSRRPSEFGAIERFKLKEMELDRRNSMPSRLRTASVSSSDPGTTSDLWAHVGSSPVVLESTPPSSVTSNDLKRPDTGDRSVTCLLAEDNPISMKIMETLLTRMGCRCVLVTDGAEAISVALGDIKFDCIFMDYQMPVVDGETAARYIKSTHNKNQNTPIIAVSAYSSHSSHHGNLFSASLMKPLNKADLLAAMRQLGFKISTQDSSKPNAKVITR